MKLVTWKIRLVLIAPFAGDEGQDLVEYAMIFALMSLGTVAAIGQVGSAVAGILNKLAAILFAALR